MARLSSENPKKGVKRVGVWIRRYGLQTLLSQISSRPNISQPQSLKIVKCLARFKETRATFDLFSIRNIIFSFIIIDSIGSAMLKMLKPLEFKQSMGPFPILELLNPSYAVPVVNRIRRFWSSKTVKGLVGQCLTFFGFWRKPWFLFSATNPLHVAFKETAHPADSKLHGSLAIHFTMF